MFLSIERTVKIFYFKLFVYLFVNFCLHLTHVMYYFVVYLHGILKISGN